jgi:hypothetical protein
MPWVRFTKPFDFFVRHNVCFSYRANRAYLVKQICAQQAVEKGSAILIERPKRDADQNHISTGKSERGRSEI